MAIENNYIKTPDAVCQTGPDPQVMMGFFIQLLAMHYADVNNVVHPSLKANLWKPDDEVNQQINTNLLITTLAKFDAAKVGLRPSIVVYRQSTEVGPKDAIGGTYQSLSLLLGAQGMDANKWPHLGGAVFEYPVHGQLIFWCLNKEGAAAEILATETANMLLGWIPLLYNELNVWDFLPMSIGGLQRIEEAKQHWAVPIRLDFAYRHRINLRPQSPLLKHILLTSAI